MDADSPEPRSLLPRLAGTWSGTETLHPAPWSPRGGQAHGRLTCRMACGGLFLVTDYEQSQDGETAFTGHGVYGWDADSGDYVMHWFDATTAGGTCRPVRGAWIGDTLTFATDGPRRVRYVYRLDGRDALHFRMESWDGSAWQPLMEASYARE